MRKSLSKRFRKARQLHSCYTKTAETSQPSASVIRKRSNWKTRSQSDLRIRPRRQVEIEPTIKAVETVDACLGRIESAVRAKGGAMLITADHGNAEMMIDPVTGGPHTAHTTNPVPFIVVASDAKQYTLKPNGSLRDISPTMLGMLGVDEPKEMTGTDLRAFLKNK